MKQFKVGDKVRIQPVWDGLPCEGTGVVMYVTPPGEFTPEHIAVATYGNAYRPSVCKPTRYARYFVRRDNPRDKDNPYLITISTLPLTLIDVIAPGHNPDKLTVEQVGEGWWLPEWEILKKLSGSQKVKHFEMWSMMDQSSAWSDFMTASVPGCTCTYRTRLTRDELLALITPKKRLLRVEELPPVCHIGNPGQGSWLVTSRLIEKQIIYSSNDLHFTIGSLHKLGRQYTSDFKTWHSFEVEDDK